MSREASHAGFVRKPRTAREAELLEKTETFMACGVRNASFNPDYAMVIQEAHGATITDCSGNRYIDYLLGSGPMFLGHAHPAVVDAAREQSARGSSYLMVNEPAILLAEAIVRAVPCAEKVTFHCSGTEATFFALRLARAYRKRDKILKFEGGFHGMHDYALMSNQWTFEPAAFPRAVANSAGIPHAIESEVLIAPFNDIETTASLIKKHADTLGAVIVEPLCRTIPPRNGFLQALREVTRRHDLPLIFDEVVTGFRLGLGGAQSHYGVTPDLCALGKTISGGHPLGVVCGRADILDAADPSRTSVGGSVRLSGTYMNNPISSAVALAVIRELEKPGVYEGVIAKGTRLMQGLEKALHDAGIAARVCGEPTVFQPWFTDQEIRDHRSTLKQDHKKSARFVDLLLDRGVVKAHEKFFVSTAHRDDQIIDTLDAVQDAAHELAKDS